MPSKSEQLKLSTPHAHSIVDDGSGVGVADGVFVGVLVKVGVLVWLAVAVIVGCKVKVGVGDIDILLLERKIINNVPIATETMSTRSRMCVFVFMPIV